MKKIKIALQKSGRLADKSVELLRKCGLDFGNYKSSLISSCSNFPLEILFLRDDDIPEYVQDGIAQLGICGENIIAEKQVNVSTLQSLGFCKCSLSIAVPNNSEIKKIKDLQKKSIATTYPNILKKFLAQKKIQSEIIEISGSAEISPALGLSDGICDLIETGGTLKSHGLKRFIDVMNTQAVLICNHKQVNNPLIEELLLRIRSVLRAEGTKYVVLNAEKKNLDKIIKLLPGVKSPTVVPLAEAGWVAIHSVISEKDFWEKISQLKNAGAQGMVVMETEKIIL